MAEKTGTGLVTEWHTGAAFLLAAALVGFAVGLAVPFQPPRGPVLGFVVGTIVAFLAIASLRAGR